MSDPSEKIAALVAKFVEELLTIVDVDDDVIESVIGSLGDDKAPRKSFLSKGSKPSREKAGATGGKVDLKVDHTESKTVVICENYSPKSHAVFGDFGGRYSEFKDAFLKKNGWLSYNAKLAFGPGWVVIDKKKLTELVKGLKKAKIPHRKIDRSDYEEEIRSGNGNSGEPSDEESSEEKVSSKSTSSEESEDSSEEEAPKKKQVKKASSSEDAPKKSLAIKKNAWGNFEESKHGIVFMNLPVAPKGQKKKIAVGWQNPDAPKTQKGVNSLYPLDEDYIEVCEDKKWNHLTDAMVKTVKKHNKKLGKELEDLMLREMEDPEDSEDLEIDESSE